MTFEKLILLARFCFYCDAGDSCTNACGYDPSGTCNPQIITNNTDKWFYDLGVSSCVDDTT